MLSVIHTTATHFFLAFFTFTLLVEQLVPLCKEEEQGLDACCDEDDNLHGVVLCTGARVAAGHDGVQHDLHAILDQEVGKVEALAISTERVVIPQEEHELQEPGHRAQHTERHDKVAHDIGRVVVECRSAA